MLISPLEREDAAAVSGAALLLVSADSSIQDLFHHLFGDTYTLRFAGSQPTALAELSRAPVDLIILDVTDPTFDGLGVLSALRADGGSELPIILISDLRDNHTAVQGLQGGANDYITKPLDENVVRARIETQAALKQAEDERKASITHLKFTQEMQENFTRIVSHDLKGPLTNIRMAQFMLRDILNENDEASSILDNMDATLNGMIEMLRVFLEAMDSQRLEPKIAALSAHDLIVQAIEQYRLAAQRKNIRLAMRDSDRLVLADERLLSQMIGNLLSNAVKFSPRGTETALWTEEHGDAVRICVADQGPGIPPDERRRLFQMFSKLSTRPTAGESSTGLGLWIVKELAQIQNGRVGVDQPAAGGSVFWVELPSVPPQA
jgi:signal transduction histidine kinase